ncbi:MAG: hypothetical protein WAN46_12690 [Gammaproteobacteria bacterium]|jgi:asparagine synthase (glutamine-hydrolysing)
MLRHPLVTIEIDLQGICHYLYFHVVPTPSTLFKGIRKLLPEQLLIAHRGKAETTYLLVASPSGAKRHLD